MSVIAQILQRLPRAGDKTAQCAEGFGEGPVGEGNAVLDAEYFRRATAVFAASEDGMRFVDEDTRAMGFGHGDQFFEIPEVAVH